MTERALPDDPGLRAVLTHLGVPASALLGHGGEAWVYAVDDERVVRVLHEGGSADHLRERASLVAELVGGSIGVALPEVLDIGEVGGRVYAVERRLAGRSVLDELTSADRSTRDRLIAEHLDVAASLGDLPLAPRPWFGELIGPAPLRTDSWRDFLVEKAARGLAAVPDSHLDPVVLADDLPDPAVGAFVHLDAFAGNMLAVDDRVTAVIDIGVTAVVGDRRLDPVTAVVYLCAEHITPTADAGDRRAARAWLRSAGLADLEDPVRRWIATYWAWAVDDVALHRWCRSVLV